MILPGVMGELLRADPTMMDNSTFIHSLRRKAASEKKGMCYTQVSAEDHSEPHLQAALPRAYPAEKDGATPQNGRGHGVVWSSFPAPKLVVPQVLESTKKNRLLRRPQVFVESHLSVFSRRFCSLKVSQGVGSCCG